MLLESSVMAESAVKKTDVSGKPTEDSTETSPSALLVLAADDIVVESRRADLFDVSRSSSRSMLTDSSSILASSSSPSPSFERKLFSSTWPPSLLRFGKGCFVSRLITLAPCSPHFGLRRDGLLPRPPLPLALHGGLGVRDALLVLLAPLHGG